MSSPLKGRKVSAATIAKRKATLAAKRAQREIPLDDIPIDDTPKRKYAKRKDVHRKNNLVTIRALLTSALALLEGV